MSPVARRVNYLSAVAHYDQGRDSDGTVRAYRQLSAAAGKTTYDETMQDDMTPSPTFNQALADVTVILIPLRHLDCKEQVQPASCGRRQYHTKPAQQQKLVMTLHALMKE